MTWMTPANTGERILWGALVVALILLGFATFVAVRKPEPFDPISFTSQSIERIVVVVPTVPGFPERPAVRVGDSVPASGIRCNTTDRPVNVTADLYWVRVDQPGSRVARFTGFPDVIPPGCVPLRFENDIPDDVTERVTQPQQWRIAGSVTPNAPHGVPEPWTTEPFWLIP